MLDLFTLLVFLFVLATFYALRSINRRQLLAEARLRRLAQLQAQLRREEPKSTSPRVDIETIALARQSELLPKWPWLGRKLDRLRAGVDALGWLPSLRKRLLLSGCVGLGVALVLVRTAALPMWIAPLFAVILWLAGCAWVYQAATTKRLALLARSLPEAIDAITRVCRAGVPLQSAFGVAASHLRGPLAEELDQIDQWLKLGVPVKQAMQHSALRVPLAEYRFFAVILIISQESGGRLGDTLERLSATLRGRAELAMKVQAKTSEARASAKIVALLVPGVLLYTYFRAPEDYRFLFNHPMGIKVMLYTTISVGLGLLITHLMVRRIR